MRITQIHYEYGAKLSTGNYGSEEVRLGLVGDLEPGDDWLVAADELARLAKSEAERYLGLSRFRAVRRAIADVEPDPDPDSPF